MASAGTTPRRELVAISRGEGFGAIEVGALLELLEELLPVGRDGWDFVLSMHNHHFGAFGRTVYSIRRKLAMLCRSRIPTGNPTFPAEGLAAKRIRYLRTQRADIGDGDNIADAEVGIPPAVGADSHLADPLSELASGASNEMRASSSQQALHSKDDQLPLTPDGTYRPRTTQFYPRPLVTRHGVPPSPSDGRRRHHSSGPASHAPIARGGACLTRGRRFAT
jgi:hypothetical protein